MFFVARCDGSEVLELVEEALDEVPVAIQEGAEGWLVHPARDWLHVGPGSLGRHGLAQDVAVVGAIGDQGLAGPEGAQHGSGAATVMSLPFAQRQRDRKAVGVHESMDLGRQPASRAPHALGSSVVPSGGRGGVRTPFLTLPPC